MTEQEMIEEATKKAPPHPQTGNSLNESAEEEEQDV